MRKSKRKKIHTEIVWESGMPAEDFKKQVNEVWQQLGEDDSKVRIKIILTSVKKRDRKHGNIDVR